MEQAPPGATTTPLDWAALRFHPLGLYDLRRRLEGSIDPRVLRRFNPSFEAAEVAWFAAGLASSPSNVRRNEFYPELHDLQNNMSHSDGTETRKALRKRVLNVTFDCAALMDRAFGSTTLMVHIPSTTRPGSLKQEDYVKADLYFPGHLPREDESSLKAIAEIAQKFIKDVGLPAIARYEHCALLRWNLPRPSNTPTPYAQRNGPVATPSGSSIFTYHGRTPRVPVVIVDDEDEDVASTSYQHELQNELTTTRQSLLEVKRSLADSRRQENELLAEIERLISASTAPLIRPTTTFVARPTPHTPDRSKAVGHRMKSPLALFTPGVSASVTPNRSPHGVRDPASPSGREYSSGGLSARSKTGSPAKATDISFNYNTFIKANRLEGKFFEIETVRSNVAMYLWRVELLKAGITDDIVDNLMHLMSSQPMDSD